MSLTKIPSSGLGSNLTLTGTTYISGNILPTSNNTINIGSPDARFGTLYISANTIDIGGAQISTTETGDISFTTTTGSLELSANVIEFLSNISSTVSSGYTGSAGAAGATGATGGIGFTGSVGAGYTGSQGTAGYAGSKGDTGLGFIIAKSYISVAALQADTAPSGIVAGQFAIIDNGNTNNEENSRLYIWTGSAYTYVSDLSGAQGITGPAGAAGYTGSIGFTGSVGPAGTGYTGSAGAGTNLNTSESYLTTGSTSGTGWQKVPINTSKVDEGSWWDNVNRYFKPTSAGWYLVSGRARTNSATLSALAIGVNGAHVQGFGNDINGNQIAIGGSQVVYLNGTTDYVDLRAFANANGVAYTTGTYDTYIQISGPLQAGPTGATGATGLSGTSGTVGYTGSAGAVIAGSAAYYNTRTYTGNGTQTAFAVTVGASDNTVIVTENGVVQTPVADYTVAGSTLTFAVAPENAVAIQIRELSTGGITGGGADQVFVVNDLTVTANYAIPSGKSASTVGPITINDNIIVSVPTGSRWVIL